ncbi:hypothetical protein ACVWW1_008960 [Bradyrhizobium sp. JR3.5]
MTTINNCVVLLGLRDHSLCNGEPEHVPRSSSELRLKRIETNVLCGAEAYGE